MKKKKKDAKKNNKNGKKRDGMNWCADPNFVMILNGAGIKPEIGREFVAGDIDVPESLKNIGRFEEGIDEERALEIGINAEAGMEIPMLGVCRFKGREKLLILSGLHRHTGHQHTKWADDPFPTYYFEIDDEIKYKILSFVANRVEGVGNNTQDAVHLAADIIVNTGRLSKKEAAVVFNVKEDAIQKRIQIIKTRNWIKDAGADDTHLKDSHITRLAPIAKHSIVLREIVNLTKDFPNVYSTDKLITLVAEVKGETTEEDMLKVVHAERKAQAKVKKAARANKLTGKKIKITKGSLSRKSIFVRLISSITGMLKVGSSIDQFGFDRDSQECAEIEKECIKAAKRLRSLFK